MDSHDYWLITEVRAAWSEGIADSRESQRKIDELRQSNTPSPRMRQR
jgi:hypothetical protein